jgi:hypothetical protein
LVPFWGRGGRGANHFTPDLYQGLAGVWTFHGCSLWVPSWGLQLPRQEPKTSEFWACCLSGGSSAAVATPFFRAGTIPAILLPRPAEPGKRIGKHGARWAGRQGGRTNSSYQSRTQLRARPHLETQPPISFSACVESWYGAAPMWLLAGNGALEPAGRFGKDQES